MKVTMPNFAHLLHGRRRAPGRSGRGFTFVELLISMLLFSLLALGINMIFRMASETISVGQRVGEMTRNARSVVAIMQADAALWAADSPVFFIDNQYTGGRRVDRIGFFGRGFFQRRTAADGQAVSALRSNEAFFWYGHTGAAGVTDTSPLGRQVILLKDKILVVDPNERGYLRDPATVPLSPLAAQSRAADNSLITLSRYDLAFTTIDQFRQDLAFVRPSPDIGSTWWQEMIYRFDCLTRLNRPITAAQLARISPRLLDNCTDFIVEFAGDYLRQDPDTGAIVYGTPPAPAPPTMLDPDGVIDFDIVGPPEYPQRRIRWYGLTAGGGPGVAPVFNTLNMAVLMQPKDYYFDRSFIYPIPSPGSTGSLTSYTNVWVNGDRIPRMIRITFRQIDPEGKIQDGIWTQFVAGPR